MSLKVSANLALFTFKLQLQETRLHCAITHQNNLNALGLACVLQEQCCLVPKLGSSKLESFTSSFNLQVHQEIFKVSAKNTHEHVKNFAQGFLPFNAKLKHK